MTVSSLLSYLIVAACFLTSKFIKFNFNYKLDFNLFHFLVNSHVVEEFYGQTFSRILLKIDLNLIYPNQSSEIDIKLANTHSVPDNLDYDLVYENKTLYFLSWANRLTEIDFDLVIKDENPVKENLTKIFKIYMNIIEDYDARNIFEVTFHQTTLAELIEAEEAIKHHFRTVLWNLEGRYWSHRSTVLNAFRSRSFNDKLDIQYIKPIPKFNSEEITSYKVGIGSWYPISDILQSLFVLKRESNCESAQDDKLKKFKNATNLNFDLCSIRTYSPSIPSTSQSFNVQANYTIKRPEEKPNNFVAFAMSFLVFIGLAAAFMI